MLAERYEPVVGQPHLLVAVLNAGLLQHHMRGGSGPGGAAVVLGVLLRA